MICTSMEYVRMRGSAFCNNVSDQLRVGFRNDARNTVGDLGDLDLGARETKLEPRAVAIFAGSVEQ